MRRVRRPPVSNLRLFGQPLEVDTPVGCLLAVREDFVSPCFVCDAAPRSEGWAMDSGTSCQKPLGFSINL